GGLRAASRPRAASGGPGAHAEKREPTHALADAEQAPHASHHLFLQDGAQACPRDGAVRQSVGVGATHLNHDQHLCDTFNSCSSSCNLCRWTCCAASTAGRCVCCLPCSTRRRVCRQHRPLDAANACASSSSCQSSRSTWR